MATVYILRLADVRGQVDSLVNVAAFSRLEEGQKWEQAQRAERPYVKRAHHPFTGQDDYPYELTYREGSPLEWFNPPNDFGAGFSACELPNCHEEHILQLNGIVLDPQ